MKDRVIGLAADHAGYQMKELVAQLLNELGYQVNDYGCSSEESVDYPTFAHKLAQGVEQNECQLGFAFCGSANGISIALNKHQQVRAALCWRADVAQLAREHNDANVCSIPARFLSKEEVLEIAKTFLATEFEGGRHQRRVDMIPVCK